MREFLEQNGYSNVREVNGRGWCGTRRMVFTTGLFFGLDEFGYYGRYCYHTSIEAIKALENLDGENDPSGEWIKYKGYGGDRSRIPDEFEKRNT